MGRDAALQVHGVLQPREESAAKDILRRFKLSPFNFLATQFEVLAQPLRE